MILFFDYVLAIVMVILLGIAYVKGYDFVKQRSPEHLPQFYLIMATIRMLIVLTMVGIAVFLTDNREDTIRFALTILIVYAVMMVITLKLRH